MICTGCGQMVDPSAQFCSACGRPLPRYAVPPVAERLFRPREGRMIAGVCAGFALRYGWDVVVVRLVLVLGLIFSAGTASLAYLVAWIVMPNGQYLLPVVTTPMQAGSAPGAQGTQTGAGPGSMTV